MSFIVTGFIGFIMTWSCFKSWNEFSRWMEFFKSFILYMVCNSSDCIFLHRVWKRNQKIFII